MRPPATVRGRAVAAHGGHASAAIWALVLLLVVLVLLLLLLRMLLMTVARTMAGAMTFGCLRMHTALQ